MPQTVEGDYIQAQRPVKAFILELSHYSNSFHTPDIDGCFGWPASARPLALTSWSDLEGWSVWVHSGAPLAEQKL